MEREVQVQFVIVETLRGFEGRSRVSTKETQDSHETSPGESRC